MRKPKHRLNSGITLVEVIISATVILIFILTLVGVHNLYLKVAYRNLKTIQASSLAEEGIEAMRFKRDLSWNNNIAPLSTGVSYYLIFENNAWSATTVPMLVDFTFDRKVTLEPVYRDLNDDLTSINGTLDPDARKIVVTVSWWDRTATTTKTISTYLTNLTGN